MTGAENQHIVWGGKSTDRGDSNSVLAFHEPIIRDSIIGLILASLCPAVLKQVQRVSSKCNGCLDYALCRLHDLAVKCNRCQASATGEWIHKNKLWARSHMRGFTKLSLYESMDPCFSKHGNILNPF